MAESIRIQRIGESVCSNETKSMSISSPGKTKIINSSRLNFTAESVFFLNPPLRQSFTIIPTLPPQRTSLHKYPTLHLSLTHLWPLARYERDLLLLALSGFGVTLDLVLGRMFFHLKRVIEGAVQFLDRQLQRSHVLAVTLGKCDWLTDG